MRAMNKEKLKTNIKKEKLKKLLSHQAPPKKSHIKKKYIIQKALNSLIT